LRPKATAAEFFPFLERRLRERFGMPVQFRTGHRSFLV
jgi:hypothetical protein